MPYKIGRNCFNIKASADNKKEAEVLIYGEIGESWHDESVEGLQFVKDLQELDVEIITARINSFGGSVVDGLAIYNALKRHPAQVNVEIDGLAASIASLIAQAGDYVGMAENARMMVHAPWAGAIGNAVYFREVANQLDGWAESMATAYARGGMSYDDALALLTDGDDHWYGASEALSAGLVDNITDALDVAAKYQENRFTQPAASTVAANTQQEHITMPEEVTPATGNESQTNVVDIQNATKDKVRAELTARNNHLKLMKGMATDQGVRDLIDNLIADPSVSLDDACNQVSGKLGEVTTPVAAPSQIEVVADQRDKFKTGVAAALASRMRIADAKDDRTNEFRGRSLSDIAATALSLQGINVAGMTRSDIASLIMASHTTSDFPILLADAANKKLQAAYEEFASTWRLWCNTGEVTDFKQVNLIRMGSFNSLETVLEGDEYQTGSVSEEKETLQALTKGRFIRLTRQMLINDDLNGFSRLAGLLGRAAARTVNKDVYTLLNSNPAMSDGNDLFSSAHSNVAASGAAMSVATLGAGRVAMRKQQGPGNKGDYLNIMPAYLMVPVVLEDAARTLMESETDFSSSNSKKPNVVRNMAEIVSDPYLDLGSTTAWYLAADKNDAPLMEVHFLDGNDTPFVDQAEEFLTDAIQWKVRLDYGIAANDFRGGYKNAGA